MPSTSKDTVVERQKAAIKVPDGSKPSKPVADKINIGGVAKLTHIEFEIFVSKVPNISQLSQLSKHDPSKRNSISAITDGTEPYRE